MDLMGEKGVSCSIRIDNRSFSAIWRSRWEGGSGRSLSREKKEKTPSDQKKKKNLSGEIAQ